MAIGSYTYKVTQFIYEEEEEEEEGKKKKKSGLKQISLEST